MRAAGRSPRLAEGVKHERRRRRHLCRRRRRRSSVVLYRLPFLSSLVSQGAAALRADEHQIPLRVAAYFVARLRLLLHRMLSLSSLLPHGVRLPRIYKSPLLLRAVAYCAAWSRIARRQARPRLQPRLSRTAARSLASHGNGRSLVQRATSAFTVMTLRCVASYELCGLN
jgi:hypothetical protein